jgi:uncharacterized protein YdbL (DUF1318 family)
MRRLAALKILALASLLVAACVTINVYFPAQAAEKAADRIIDDVWGPQSQPAPKSDDKTSLLLPGGVQRVLVAAAGAVLDIVIPAAQAQVDLDVSTPEIRAITASMESRHAQLAKYYSSGAVGFTSDGLVEVRDQNAIALPERNAVRQLVADENRDRSALYTQIAKANSHPEWEKDIRETFAKRWIAKAQSGWYYKDGGAWKQK